jgi:UrcA family protein
MKRFIAIIVACLAFASAHAGEEVVIDYSDLNMNTADGAGILYGRIVHAAQSVCHEVPLLDTHRYLNRKSCIESAIQNAVKTVGNPLLSARHQREYTQRLYSSRATTK